MKIKKSFRIIALLMLGACVATSCSDDDDDDEVKPEDQKETVVENNGPTLFILNEGLMNQNNSTLSSVNLSTNENIKDVFSKVNGRGLGDTGQDVIVYGSKMYINVNVSNTIEVIDAKTLKSLAQIVPTAQTGTSPRNLISHNGKVYVSMYDGHVAMIDTSSLKIEKSVKVGNNPEEMAISNGYLYVANSDGMGDMTQSSISKIDLKTFTEEKKIEVKSNPVGVLADKDGNIYVNTWGNYADIASSIFKITADDKTTDLKISANVMTISGSTIYAINAPWGGEIEYKAVDTKTGKVTNGNFMKGKELPGNPHSITIDESTGTMYIGTYAAINDYQSDGFVYAYGKDSAATKYNVGVGPRKIIIVR